MHWLLDVAFKDDLARTRTGHGAKNMSAVRRFSLGLVRTDRAKGSVKTKRKAAGWSTDRLANNPSDQAPLTSIPSRAQPTVSCDTPACQALPALLALALVLIADRKR